MRYFVPILFCIALAAGPAAAGEKSEAVQTMANILAELNHFPSDENKEALKELISDERTTEQERVVAEALMNVAHQVSAEDKPLLEALIENASAPDAVQTLAEVIVNLNHAPTDKEKKKLRAIGGSKSR